MNKLVHQTSRFLKRNGSTILTCVGAAGVVATSIMAVKATPKALRVLELAKEEKSEELTVLETVKMAGPAYIPSILVGASTIACIFGANVLNKRQQAVLVSAYALLDSAYKDYKNKVEELYGEESTARIREELAKDKYEEIDIPTEGDEILFYDEMGQRYFNATMAAVKNAEYQLNRDIQMQGFASLNDFYEHIGIDPIDGGDALGWTEAGNRAEYWQAWVDFHHYNAVMDDGLECCILSTFEEPVLDYQMYC